MFHMLSALPSTDTGPLPSEGDPSGCGGVPSLLAEMWGAGKQQAYDLDCVLHINTWQSRAQTVAVESVSRRRW